MGENSISLLQIIVGVVVAAWGIWQTYAQHQLTRKIDHINAMLDNELNTLYRVRERLLDFHKFAVYNQLASEEGVAKSEMIEERSKAFVALAELHGLIEAINDEELRTLLVDIQPPSPDSGHDVIDIIGNKIPNVHKRLTILINERTAQHTQ